MTNPLNTIPPKYRGIIYLLITIVVIVATWWTVKEVQAYIRRNKERKNPKEVVKAATDELKTAISKGETLSKSDSEYKSTANLIEKELDGCETITSEVDAILAIIKVVKKPVDWLKLQVEFGVREISQCGTFGQIKDSYDLATLLKDQLDSTSLNYTINIDGYKDSGVSLNSINILYKYFKTIGITI